MRLKCLKTGNNKSISVNEDYDLIEESETRYTLINDNGVQKNYAKNLFRVIAERPARPVPPPTPVIPVINELNITTAVVKENDTFGFTVSCPFIGRNVFNYDSRQIVNFSRIAASCGVFSFLGLNNIVNHLLAMKENFTNYLRQHTTAFTLNPEINIDETFRDIYVSIIQDIIASFQGNQGNRCAVFIMSTTTNVFNELPVFRDVLNELSSSVITANNPNSGNRISTWTFVVNEDDATVINNNHVEVQG
jgi:hypothetical protein